MALTKVTGSVIKDSVSLSGNVSIGGTLTYQDVTNVDALGIGTFRTGINVSGGQLDVGSNIKLGNAGVITATSFSGNPAGTSSLDAGILDLKTGGNLRLRFSSGGTAQFRGDVDPIASFDRGSANSTNVKWGYLGADRGIISSISNEFRIAATGTNPMTFHSNGNERLRIDTSGRLLVGKTTGNSANLLVQSGAQVFAGANNGNSSCLTMDYNTANGAGRIMGHASSGGMLQFFTNASGAGVTPKLTIDSTGKLLKGHSADVGQIRTQFNQDNQFIGGNNAGIRIGSYSNNAYASSLEFIKSRSATLGTNTLIQNGDTLGQIYWGAADGSNYQPAAFVSAAIEGAPNTNDVPTRLSFGTTKDGAAGAGEKMRINPAGQIMIGDSTVGSSTNDKLIIQGMVTNDNFESSIALRRGSTIGSNDAGLGYINFQDSAGSTGAQIGGRADSGWSGSTRPTHLLFATVKSGSTSLTEACRITSGGYLQQHNLPIASYSDTRQISLSSVDLTGSNFYNYLWYTSDSNLFDSSTGHFIAPVHGIYRLYFRCTTDSTTGNRANVRLRKNGSTRNEAYASNQSGSNNIQSVSSEIVDVLNAGEYFDIQVAQLHTQGGTQHKQVTFHMLG